MEEVLNDVSVKNEPICYSQSISQTKEVLGMKIKEEPIEIEMKKSKSHIESKSEEKFSAREEFANKISIAFLNEETTQETSTNTNQEE
jgi:hypothetical protein